MSLAIAWEALGKNNIIRSYPCEYNKPFPELAPESRDSVYVLDFSVPDADPKHVKTLEAFNAVTEGKLFVLDHHKTVPDGLKSMPWMTFDNTLSGAGLTWQHFYPVEKIPFAVELVQWRDLGHTWQDPEHINSVLSMEFNRLLMRMTPRCPFEWAKFLSLTQEEVIFSSQQAIPLVERDMLITQAAASRCNQVAFGALIVPAIDAMDRGLISDALHAVLQAHPEAAFAIHWTLTPDGYLLSLRSRKGGYDVGELCRSFGGGGHHCAAGCTVQFLNFV